MSIDRTVGDTFYIAFTSRAFATGIPGTLGGVPVISAYEDAGLVQITAGITLGVDHDAVTGLNMLTLVATGANGYESGKDYQLVITTGTVDGVSVVGEVVGQFSLGLSAAAVDLANATDGLGALKTETAAILDDTGTSGVLLGSTATSAQLVDDVWDEVLTGATHNVSQSSGRRLRSLGSLTIFEGTASAGTGDSITLTGGSTTDGLYVGAGINIQAGTGAGQSRYIVSYNGTTKVAEVARAWTTNPSTDSEFVVTSDHQIDFIHMGVAQAGASNSITLAADASVTDDIYKGNTIRIMAGTGDDQVRMITAYNGTTKVATVTPAWEISPAVGSAYATLNGGLSNLVSVDSTVQTAGDLAALITGLNDVAATDIVSAGAITTLSGAIVNVDLVDTTTTNTDMRGTDSAATATSLATAQTDLDTITGADGVIIATLQPNNGLGAIQKNVALSDFELLMVLTSDHVSPGTGLTVTAERSIDGAAFVAVSGTIAEVSNGIYQFDAAAADTNGSLITWRFSAATADDNFFTFKTTS